MSRLTDLLRRVEQQNPDLARDLATEVKKLAARRSFGLNFERHVPETIALPGRKVRRGDKVRFRAPRGESDKGLDPRTWIVTRIEGRDQQRNAHLIEHQATNNPETAHRLAEDLAVVAEFRDPIYPGLKSTGKVERGGDKPYHTVINSENYHALEALLFAHEGKVDCIYIDPPYNSGARDWKYNNDYVDSDDAYRHSKWLAMMERRLRIAKNLLNPKDSVLITSIDENEHLRLGLLLEQVFSGSKIQMISSVINPKGTARSNEFSRVDEYVYFVFIGEVRMNLHFSDMLTARDYSTESDVRWRGLARTGRKGLRANNPGSWYPIFVNQSDQTIHSIGDSVPYGGVDSDVEVPEGTVAVWPPSSHGQQYSWSTVPSTLRTIQKKGGLKTGRIDLAKGSFPFYYLSFNAFEKIERGDIVVTGSGPNGELEIEYAPGTRTTAPKTVWNQVAHDAGSHGTGLLRALLPTRRFPFPKSLYTVEDAIRFFVKDKHGALILDFFCGSGTTAHAVMRLNRQDGGSRRSIMVTNNEVSNDEAVALLKQGYRPGDHKWEAIGICEYITKPRIEAAITGTTPEGEPIRGDYKFADEFPMAEGFEENAEFFDLTYEDPERVRHDLAFSAIAPLLWMKAGSEGRRIDTPSDSFNIADTYGVLFNVDAASGFVKAVAESKVLRLAYIVTDDEKQYQMIADELPRKVQPVRLYESYLRTFQIHTAED